MNVQEFLALPNSEKNRCVCNLSTYDPEESKIEFKVKVWDKGSKEKVNGNTPECDLCSQSSVDTMIIGSTEPSDPRVCRECLENYEEEAQFTIIKKEEKDGEPGKEALTPEK